MKSLLFALLLMATSASATTIITDDLTYGGDLDGPDISSTLLLGEPGHFFGEAAIVFNGPDGIVAFNDVGLLSNNCRAFVSGDWGETYPLDVYIPNKIRNRNPFTWTSDPALTKWKDGYGNVRMAFSVVGLDESFLTNNPRGDCSAPSAMFMTTTRSGTVWSLAQQVADIPDALEDRPWMVGDIDGEPRALWATFNGVRNASGENRCEDATGVVYFTKSVDDGDTWLPPISISSDYQPPMTFAISDRHAIIPFWRSRTLLQVARCSPEDGCLVTDSIGAMATSSDHYYLPGLPYTRLNSMPTIACDHQTQQRCIIAWMNVTPGQLGGADRSLIYTAYSEDGGWTWTGPTYVHLRNDQALPMLSWGNTYLGLCWYQRYTLPPNSQNQRFDIFCARSTDGGKTWQTPTQVNSEMIWVPNNPTYGILNFIGDYNMYDAQSGKVAYTTFRYFDSGVPLSLPPPPLPEGRAYNPKHGIEISNYSPDPISCNVGPPTSRGWWLLVFPLLILLLRARTLALALLLLVCTTSAKADESVCAGDCNLDEKVRVDELVTLVNIALELQPITSCEAHVPTCGGEVEIFCLTGAIINALEGCPTDVETK